MALPIKQVQTKKKSRCDKCNKKKHIARNCTEKIDGVQEETEVTNSFRVQEGTESIKLSEEAKVNGQPVKRIQLDSGAYRTMVDRSLISPADIGEKSIVVTFGNVAVMLRLFPSISGPPGLCIYSSQRQFPGTIRGTADVPPRIICGAASCPLLP